MSRKSQSKKKPQPIAPTKKVTAPLIPEQYHRYLIIAMFLLGFIACGAFSLSLGQDNNWDLRNYHYYNPYAFLNDRIGFDYGPAQLQSYLNPVADLPFYWAVNHLSPKIFGFLMGGMHGLAFGLIFMIAFSILRRQSPNTRLILSTVCGILGLYGPVFAGELGATQNDPLVSLFVFAGLFLLLRELAKHDSLSGSRSRFSLIAAGILFGIGLGMKLTLAVAGVGTVAALVYIERTWPHRILTAAIWGVSCVIGLLASSGFWMVKMWSVFQSPMFPFYNGIFKSPYTEATNFADARYLPESLTQALFYPFYFVTDTHFARMSNDFRDARYAIVYVLLLITLAVVWYAKQKNKSVKQPKQQRASHASVTPFATDARFLLVFFIASYVVWQLKFSVIRYTAPIEAIAPLIIVLLIYRMFSAPYLRFIVIAASCMMIAIVMRPIQHERLPWTDTFWDVAIPEFADPAKTIVVIGSNRPWGYLVPFFPPETRIVRLFSNFTNPEHSTQMQIEIRQIMKSHDGPVYLLSRPRWLKHDEQVTRAYQWIPTGTDCLPVKSKHERRGLCLWPLKKING